MARNGRTGRRGGSLAAGAVLRLAIERYQTHGLDFKRSKIDVKRQSLGINPWI